MCKNMASQCCAASLNIENAVEMGNFNKIPLTLYGNNYQKMELEFFNGDQWIPDPRNVVKNGFYLVLAIIVKKKIICFIKVTKFHKG